MVSGALLLDDCRTESAGEFYRRRLYRLGIPFVVWTVVYLGVRHFVHHEQLTAGSVAGFILGADVYYHLWFLYMIPGLYLVTPFLRRFIRTHSRKQRIIAIVTILSLSGIFSELNILYWGNHRTILTVFIPYIGYYLCGYELHNIDPRKISSKYLAVAVAACVLYMVAFLGVFIERQGGLQTNFIFGFFSLPVAIMSIAIFWAAYLHSLTTKPLTGIPKTAVQWVASTTLGIYVMHPLLLEYFRDRLGKHSTDGTFLLGIVGVPLITFIACYLLTSLIMNIPLLRRTVC
jgi:surface polysaccharide O-acyltransferase-like enzyme